MAVTVQKFGGTSVKDVPSILRCASRAVEAQKSGRQVVVVVSAMGHTTDELVSLARDITETPSPRELDMLLASGEQISIALMSMALHKLGNDAVSMTGHLMGLRTDEIHTKARIQSIDTNRIRRELDAGRIVVAAGFQGVTGEGNITTLGRGGSDTTAVALAAALLADHSNGGVVCEIYTDVDGVYTADPRIVPNARKLDRISYEEMLELAWQGAVVMHPRAVFFGQKYNVPIHVRHSAKPDHGTMICKETPEMEDIVVAGCALKRNLTRVSLRRIPNQPGVQALVFDLISDCNVIVDDIIQTIHEDSASLSFTVDGQDLAEVKMAAEKVLNTLGSGEIAVEIGLAKVSVTGVGMRNHSGVAAKMFKALGNAGINIANITTSDIKISCLIAQDDADNSLRVIHDTFDLGKSTNASTSDVKVHATT